MKCFSKKIFILFALVFLSNQLGGMDFEYSRDESSYGSSDESLEDVQQEGMVFIINGTSCSGKTTLSRQVKKMLENFFNGEHEVVVVGIDDYDATSAFKTYWDYRSSSPKVARRIKDSGGYSCEAAKKLYAKYKGEDSFSIEYDLLYDQVFEFSTYPNFGENIKYLKEACYGVLVDVVRDLVKEGKIVICDVVLADTEGKRPASLFVKEFIQELNLEKEQVFTILNYCPFSQLFARVDGRNRIGDAREKRTLDQPLCQFTSLFNFIAASECFPQSVSYSDIIDEEECIKGLFSKEKSWRVLDDQLKKLILNSLFGKLEGVSFSEKLMVIPACKHDLVVVNENMIKASKIVFNFILKKLSSRDESEYSDD